MVSGPNNRASLRGPTLLSFGHATEGGVAGAGSDGVITIGVGVGSDGVIGAGASAPVLRWHACGLQATICNFEFSGIAGSRRNDSGD